MNFVDIISLLFAAFLTITAMSRGFVYEILSLLKWVIAFTVTSTFGSSASGLIGVAIGSNNQYMLNIISYIFVFVVTILALKFIIFIIVYKMPKQVISLDKLAGASVGLVKAYLIIGIIMFVVKAVLPPMFMLNSITESFVYHATSPVRGYLSSNLDDFSNLSEIEAIEEINNARETLEKAKKLGVI